MSILQNAVIKIIPMEQLIHSNVYLLELNTPIQYTQQKEVTCHRFPSGRGVIDRRFLKGFIVHCLKRRRPHYGVL